MSQFQTKQFKKLQKDWYAKLKKEGFEEIEDVESKNEYLKVWHSQHFQKQNQERVQAQIAYYNDALEFLNTHLFETDEQKIVWELHCEGKSLRQITRELKSKVCRVYKTLNMLKAVMEETE